MVTVVYVEQRPADERQRACLYENIGSRPSLVYPQHLRDDAKRRTVERVNSSRKKTPQSPLSNAVVIARTFSSSYRYRIIRMVHCTKRMQTHRDNESNIQAHLGSKKSAAAWKEGEGDVPLFDALPLRPY